MSLSTQFLDELRQRTLLSALIGRSVKLGRAGREWKACCPFHQEKTPSFTVNDDKGFYHCFGCGAHGDAIRFLTDARGLPFMDAVKELAAAAGMDVPAPDPRAQERNDRAAGLHEIMAAAARWFEDELAGIGGGAARAYLQQRGIGEAAVRQYGLGFAPDGRTRLRAALEGHGIDRLVECGLLIRPEEGEPYDRFRGRLMIPIRDARGRVIAFGGRVIGQGEPKYLNSPETPLFDKGRTLFNLDRAGPASRQAGRVVVVEGYMDVIALGQAGIGEAVAPLGTALTEGQLERLWRLADVPILCFDGDAAGQKAAVRAALRALPMLAPGRSLSFATLPPGQDPDDLVHAGGKEAVEALFKAPMPLVEMLWRQERYTDSLKTPEERAGFGRRLRDHARTIAHEDVRTLYLADFNSRLRELFQDIRSDRIFAATTPASLELIEIGKIGIDQAVIAPAVIRGLIRYPVLISRYAETLAEIDLTSVKLRQVREAMLGAALVHRPLETAQLTAILVQEGYSEALKRLARKASLAFSFLRGNAEPERAMHDLGAVIEVLSIRAELDAALALATVRLRSVSSDAGFEEQKRLRAARDAAERSFAALAQGEDS